MSLYRIHRLLGITSVLGFFARINIPSDTIFPIMPLARIVSLRIQTGLYELLLIGYFGYGMFFSAVMACELAVIERFIVVLSIFY